MGLYTTYCVFGGVVAVLQLSGNAIRVLERRYLKKVDNEVVETPEELFRRVADNIAGVEQTVYGASPEETKQLSQRFYDLMSSLDFLPNSPTLMNAGRELQQLSACFVLPIEDSMESIFETLKNTALVHKTGGGTGFSFSRLRPRNDIVATTGGVASGPVSFLKVFDASTQAVKQGGTRRGANMGILRCDHPDIMEFITCKRDNEDITNFNLSVGITEKFMEAVKADEEYPLINPRSGNVVRMVRAREVFDLIVEMAWNNGEPGIVFLDRINRDNPTPHLGEIESTNPCGEQPLLPNESCNLGSINLSHMVKDGAIDWDKLRETVHLAVHFLDNVIDANKYPLEQIEKMTKGNRKIGLGVMGFAEMLIYLGIPYDSEESVKTAREVMRFIREEGRKASCALAEKRGVFPNFKSSIYDTAGGPRLRNATITTIAPTGTISIIANTSSGIEPLFALAFTRHVMDNEQLTEVNDVFAEYMKQAGLYSKELIEEVAKTGSLKGIDGVPEEIKRLFVTAHDISPEWHIRVQAAFQEFTDNAVSKTVNFANEATREDIRKAFVLAYELGCKGVTVYRSGSRESEVLVKGKGKKEEPKPATTTTKARPRKRPSVTVGRTEKIRTGCGNLYVTINRDEEGICEVFTAIGKAGGCAAALSEAVARLVSLALRAGVEPREIYAQLRSIRCPNPAWEGSTPVLSCPDAIAIVLHHYLEDCGAEEAAASNMQDVDNRMGACPECGGHVKHESGCVSCMTCGYTKCG